MGSEIGIDDALIPLDRQRVASGQKFAVGEAINLACHVHDCAHVVFDDEEGELQVGALETVDKAIDQCRIDACGWLIQQRPPSSR
jgi:hypothetical protein